MWVLTETNWAAGGKKDMFVSTEAPVRVSQQLAECSTDGAETRTNIVMWWNVKDLITVWNYVLGGGGRGVAVKPGGTGWEALCDKDIDNMRWEEWRGTSEGWCHSPVVRMSPVAVVEVLSASLLLSLDPSFRRVWRAVRAQPGGHTSHRSAS